MRPDVQFPSALTNVALKSAIHQGTVHLIFKHIQIVRVLCYQSKSLNFFFLYRKKKNTDRIVSRQVGNYYMIAIKGKA